MTCEVAVGSPSGVERPTWRSARGGSARALVVAVTAVLLVCVYVTHVRSAERPPGSLVRAEAIAVAAVRPPQALYGNGCKLSMFIPMTACKKDIKSDACCNALRTIMNAACVCQAMPPIVLKNGGTPLSFLDNFLGCNLRDDTHDRSTLLRARRRAPTMWHRTDGWRYVTPARLDERGDLGAALEMETARFVCKALGYRDASEWGYTDKIGSRSTGFALACPPDAADARDVRACSPLELDVSHGEPAPMWAHCNAYPGVVGMCVRPHEEVLCTSLGDNQLTGARAPDGDVAHQRAVGGSHMLCGTAGINESRIAWENGAWDDDRAYVRAHGYEVKPRVELWRGARAGAPAHDVVPVPAGEWAFDPNVAPPPPPSGEAAALAPPPLSPPYHASPPLPAGGTLAFLPPPSAASSAPSAAPPPLPSMSGDPLAFLDHINEPASPPPPPPSREASTRLSPPPPPLQIVGGSPTFWRRQRRQRQRR
ncbi:hypothetical protein KFE25_012030 [Diacronema lutheri]|uniref:Uncharacterized protein n=1 Tax=Diacronema lutheri TaxID=2081491 RepID=A0A8J5XFY6_DIALT|nr:hypothetical protein KFE25_012030 [Diacronema lutheri]